MITRPHPVTDFIGALFDFLTSPGIEGFVPRVYSDSRGIPTLGVGYALVVEGAEGWGLRGTLVADLAAIGITLTPEQRQMLQDAADVLNDDVGTNAIPPWTDGEDSEAVDVMGFLIDEGTAEILLGRIIGEYQQRVQDMLGTEAYNQLGDSKEMVALVSLAYNNVIKAGGTGTPKLREAILNDNRAEAWFQIRYKSNSPKQSSKIRTGIANRRYRESDLFSLYDAGTLTEDQEKAQSKEIMRMYTRYRKDIGTYEGKFSPTTQTAGSTFITAQTYHARETLIAYFAVGKWIDGEVIVGAGLANYGVDVTSSNDTIKNSSATSATQNYSTEINDLIFGEAGNDTIYGAGGDDVIYGGDGGDFLYGEAGDDLLYGGEGNDIYFIFAGEGTDRIEDKQGKNTVVLADNPLSLFFGYGGGTYQNADGTVSAVFQGTDFVVTDIATGTTVVLNENFQSGDFGIYLRDAPTDPVTTNTIYGDRASIYSPPQYDSLGNEITNLNIVQAGKNDRLYDSAGDDRIEGGGGNDEIWAVRGGNDLLLGGDGQDAINGGAGNDQLEGGSGSDVAMGGSGDDQVFGEASGEMEDLIAAGEIAPGLNERGDLMSRGDTTQSHYLHAHHYRNTGRAAIISVILFVFNVISPLNIAFSGEYVLLKNKDHAICNIYMENLKSFNSKKMVCERNLNPKFKDLSKPKWESFDLRRNKDLVKKIRKFFEHGDQFKPVEWMDDEKQFEDFINRNLVKTASLLVSEVDINNDRKSEQLALYSSGLCMESHSYSKSIFVLNEERTQVDISRTEPLLQNYYGHTIGDKAISHSYMIYGVFHYKDITLFDKWDVVRSSLVIYKLSQGTTEEICVYKYTEGGN